MKNEKLYSLMLNSTYPFQFKVDCGKSLQKIYPLIVTNYNIIQNNQKEFKIVLNWDNQQYFRIFNETHKLCDQIYMLTHVYLKYPIETLLFNDIFSNVENLCLFLFNDDELIKNSNLISNYYNNITDIYKIQNTLKHVYTSEMDKALIKEDKLLKKYEKDKKDIISTFLKENGL